MPAFPISWQILPARNYFADGHASISGNVPAVLIHSQTKKQFNSRCWGFGSHACKISFPNRLNHDIPRFRRSCEQHGRKHDVVRFHVQLREQLDLAHTSSICLSMACCASMCPWRSCTVEHIASDLRPVQIDQTLLLKMPLMQRQGYMMEYPNWYGIEQYAIVSLVAVKLHVVYYLEHLLR